jgi:type III secretion system YscQ/HrcQ family protein
VDRAIGAGQLFAPVRALGPAERGVLVALLAPLLDGIGWSFALGPAPDVGGAAVILRVTGAPGAGTMWLQAPQLPGRAPAIDRSRAARLPIDVAVWLASTTVARGELVDAATGDVVLFDGVAHLDAGDPAWSAELASAGFRAAARIEPDGRATICRGWRAARLDGDARGGEKLQDGKDVTMEADETIDPAAAALAAAPVEVVAELGRITLRGDEVLGLAPGVVLGLRVDRTSAVSLRIGGAIWAEGELVNVDGELGVRVTRLVPR